MTVPALGVGIRPRGPSTLPSRLTLPIMSCVARATSKSSQPSLLDLLDQVVAAGEVGAGFLGLGDVVALAEDQHAHRLADAVRQGHAAADHLVALRRVDAQRHVDFDGLVELGALHLLEQADGLLERDGAFLGELLLQVLELVAQLLAAARRLAGLLALLLGDCSAGAARPAAAAGRGGRRAGACRRRRLSRPAAACRLRPWARRLRLLGAWLLRLGGVASAVGVAVRVGCRCFVGVLCFLAMSDLRSFDNRSCEASRRPAYDPAG